MAVRNCNLTLTKIWSDNLDSEDMWIKVNVDVWNDDIYLHQSFDALISSLRELGRMFIRKTYAPEELLSMEFEPFTPVLEGKVVFNLPASRIARAIEIKAELEDVLGRKTVHSVVVCSEVQMMEDFGRAIIRVAEGDVGESRRLNPNLPARCLPKAEEDFPFNVLYG